MAISILRANIKKIEKAYITPERLLLKRHCVMKKYVVWIEREKANIKGKTKKKLRKSDGQTTSENS